jgi:hypothetical protein
MSDLFTAVTFVQIVTHLTKYANIITSDNETYGLHRPKDELLRPNGKNGYKFTWIKVINLSIIVSIHLVLAF